MNEYIYQIINFLEQYVDNKEIISNNIYQYNCVLCGRSKNNKPHMRIDYNNGFFYCYRCNRGGILYSLIKEYKTSNNVEFVNSLLSIYFDIYKYDKLEGKANLSFNNKYKYNKLNVSLNKPNIDIDSLSYNFFKYRTGLNDTDLINVLNTFKIECSNNQLLYKSFYTKFLYGYNIQDLNNYKKNKSINKLPNNDKLDYYYLINSYSNNNLYISESLFDLMTIYISNILKNNDTSNYLALCSKNYKKIYIFLLSTGKFYYDNVYIVLDNDIIHNQFIKNIINILSKNTSINKYYLYNNVYIISPIKKYVDINKQYVDNNYTLKGVEIKKII